VPPTCSAPYKKPVEKFKLVVEKLKLVIDYLRVKQTASVLEDQKRLALVNEKEDSKNRDAQTTQQVVGIV
jgi:hypothetical protein